MEAYMAAQNKKQHKADKDDTPVKVQTIITRGVIVTAIISAISAVILAILNPGFIQLLTKNTEPSSIEGGGGLAENTLLAENPPAPQPVAPSPEPVMVQPTPTPIPQPGEDWKKGCVDVAVWSPFLSGETAAKDGACYSLTDWGMAANNGAFDMAMQTTVFSAEGYGIFTPWQGWKELDVKIETRFAQNSEVWVGFFEDDDLQSAGLVFVTQDNRTIDVRHTQRINDKRLPDNFGEIPAWKDGQFPVFSPEIKIDGVNVAIYESGQPILSDYAYGFTPRYLFIGYRLLMGGSNLDATILKLGLKK